LNLVFFILGDSPASEFYMPVYSIFGVSSSSHRLWRWTECSETLEYKIQTSGIA